MRIAPAVRLTEQQRRQLEANVRGRSLPARLVERSRITQTTCTVNRGYRFGHQPEPHLRRKRHFRSVLWAF